MCVSDGYAVGGCAGEREASLSPPLVPFLRRDPGDTSSASSAPLAQGPSEAPFISHVTTGAMRWVRPKQNQRELCVRQTPGASLDTEVEHPLPRPGDSVRPRGQ